MEIFEILRDLMEAPAVTGFEDQRRQRIIDQYSKHCDSVSVDVIGNVIGTLGDGDRAVMIAGHYDQIGFMVRYVDEKGYIHFAPVGGWDQRVVYGMRVRVWIGDGPGDYLIGVVGAKPAHLAEPKEREKAVKMEEMRIDIGARSQKEAEELGVKSGCPITPDSTLTRLGREGDLVVGPAFDDVCAVASMIRALELLGGDAPKGLRVHMVATVQEEIGLRGATVSGYNLKPWCAIACDVTHAVAPGVKAERVGGVELGKGPVISVGANFTRPLWELMERVAEEAGIPHQRQGIPSRSGTDAWALQVVRGGTITGLISVPNRYMHTPNEVISLSDLENVARLMAETLRALPGSDLRHIVEVYRRG